MKKLIVLVLACLAITSECRVGLPDAKEINDALTLLAKTPHRWHCVGGDAPTQLSTAVLFYQLTCNGTSPDPKVLDARQQLLLESVRPGWQRTASLPLVNLRIQLTVADLSADPMLSVEPVVAQSLPTEPSPYREPVLSMAQSLQQQGRHALAGINGGYFFFLKPERKELFFDSNCAIKFPLNFVNRSQLTTFDIGDGVHIADGQPLSWNCPTTGDELQPRDQPARATFYVDASGAPHIANLPAGPFNYSAAGIRSALGCGPLLGQNGSIVMEWQEIPSTFEYAASTGFALASAPATGHTNAVFFTCDGQDDVAGMHSYDMASFFYDAMPRLIGLQTNSAYSLDQGGSTTMVVLDPNTNTFDQVTSSGEDRSVYNALFLFRND